MAVAIGAGSASLLARALQQPVAVVQPHARRAGSLLLGGLRHVPKDRSADPQDGKDDPGLGGRHRYRPIKPPTGVAFARSSHWKLEWLRRIILQWQTPEEEPVILPFQDKEGTGWHVVIRYHAGHERRIDGFATEAEAMDWIIANATQVDK